MSKFKYESMLLTTAALWGLTFPIMKYVGSSIESVTFLAIRFSLAALVLLFGCKKNIKNITKKMIIPSVAIGLLYAFHSFLQLEGLRYTSAANSGFITSTNVIFVPMFAFLFFKEKTDKRFIIGLIAIIIGFLLISGLVTLFPFGIHISALNIGDLLTLLCAIFTALYYVIFNRLSVKHDEVAVNLLHMIGAGAGMWILWLFYPERSVNFDDIYTIAGTIYCAVFGSAIGFLLLAKAQAKISASKVAVYCSLESVFAAVFAACIPGRDGRVEPITLAIAIGGALILYGVIKISVKKSKI